MKYYSDDNSETDKIIHSATSSPSEYSSILNAVPLALVRINSDKKITWWNERFETILSVSPDALRQSKLDDIFKICDGNDFSFFIDRLNFEDSVSVDAFKYNENSEIKYRLQFSALKNEDLSPKQILVTVTVVPENHSVDSEVNNEYLQMQNIVNTLPFLIYLISIENKFLLVNNRFCDFVGRSSSEIIGCQCSEVLSKELCDYLTKENSLLLSDKIPVEYKGIVFIADKKLNLSVKKSPLFNNDNSISAICGVIEDITEQYQMQKQLQQTQKMEAVGQLTGGIAHDFNNILASIIGYTGLIKRKAARYNDQDITGYLRQIMRSGERARDLVQQLLAFSRGDVGDLQELEPEKLAKEAIKMLASVIPSSINLNLRLNASNVKNYIEADPVQFNQSLMNLVINAKDAIGDETGYINVSVECIPHTANICNSCHINFSGKYVKLSVSDSGEGIDSDILERIFDPFFTTKEVGKGSGMGLSMLHGIVHASGGHIVVQSNHIKDNKTGIPSGTVVSVYYPVVRTGTINKSSRSYRSENLDISNIGNGKSILIIDDEDLIINWLSEFLQNNGYRVFSYTHSVNALKFFKDNVDEVDLIITDQTMPELTGLDLAKEIHESGYVKPIILCTGYSDFAEDDKSIQSNINVFLHKPYDEMLLLDHIEDLLQQH